MSSSRRPADMPLALLAAVAVTFVGGLGMLAVAGGYRPDPIGACASAVATAAAKLTTVGILAPTLIVSVVVLAGVLAVVHQLVATRSLITGLLRRRVPVSARLAIAMTDAGLASVDLVADQRAFVFCYGYLRPRVCVSTGLAGLLDHDELTAVLRHEAHHARHRDPLKILLGRALASGLFFLPIGAALRNGFLAGKEICADRDAQAVGDPMALPRALLKLLPAEQPVWPAGVLAVGALSPTEVRIQSLLQPEVTSATLPPVVDWIVTLAVIAGIFGFSVGSSAAREERVFGSCAPAVAQVAQTAPAPLTGLLYVAP